MAKEGKKKGSCLKTLLIIVLAFVVIGGIGSAIGGDKDKAQNTTKKTAASTEKTEEQDKSTEPKEEQAAPDNSEDDQVPKEYKSALNKANSYSETMHMSKAGLYNQLTSEYGEQFSAEAAQYAIDNVQADWNANALKKAKDYQDTMDMSPEAIRDQLVSEYGEQFTAEEAEYAIESKQL